MRTIAEIRKHASETPGAPFVRADELRHLLAIAEAAEACEYTKEAEAIEAARAAGMFGDVDGGEWKHCRACGKEFMGSRQRTLCKTCNLETGAGEP